MSLTKQLSLATGIHSLSLALLPPVWRPWNPPWKWPQPPHPDPVVLQTAEPTSSAVWCFPEEADACLPCSSSLVFSRGLNSNRETVFWAHVANWGQPRRMRAKNMLGRNSIAEIVKEKKNVLVCWFLKVSENNWVLFVTMKHKLMLTRVGNDDSVIAATRG